MSSKRILPSRILAALRDRAEHLASDPVAVRKLVEAAYAKAKADGGALDKVRGDLTSLFRLLRAVVAGRYRILPWATVVMALAALVYFVNPLDVIPDFVIGAGLLDDLTVLAFVLNAMRGDLATFNDWEKTAGPKDAKAPAADEDDDEDDG